MQYLCPECMLAEARHWLAQPLTYPKIGATYAVAEKRDCDTLHLPEPEPAGA